ncbi:conserved hypothetical protein [Ricinus communis]|uniref:Uncharacterized protein n=1 Tax=Ricinus communis TaxID=3988 RepID=B9S2P7_RICCO|nr:conserved hypothetical protein [Ricinus communis]
MLDPGTDFSPEKNHVHFPNRTSDSYDSYGAINYKARAQKTAQNYANYQNWNSTADFGAERRLIEDDDSGVCSPPLWRTSPPRSPQHRQNHYRSLSPSARTQAIVRGQKELMEMVSRMPEGCYELSLKDIVEKPMVDQVDDQSVKEESFSKERSCIVNNGDMQVKKKNEKKVNMNRSGSIDNGGFLLKMVFPISWNSRNKKKNGSKKIRKDDNSVMNNSGRVSPRPLLFDGSAAAAAKDGENEWQVRGGCWSFIFRKGGKKAE